MRSVAVTKLTPAEIQQHMTPREDRTLETSSDDDDLEVFVKKKQWQIGLKWNSQCKTLFLSILYVPRQNTIFFHYFSTYDASY